MQKAQNNHSKKYKIPLVSGAIAIGGMFLFSYLTFIPGQTFAANIVDPNEKRSLSDISTLQEMSQQICINSRENETKQLRDTRDSKTYWIAKLKDGNCWMTQNLDYDIPDGTNITLSTSDTDLASAVILNQVIKVTAGDLAGVANWSNDNAQIKYYDAGRFLKINPASIEGCTKDDATSLSDTGCSDAGWVNLNQPNYADYTANSSASSSILDSTSKTYNAHYLVGNYYSWNAATAGTGLETGETAGNRAAGSICPKGWKLPIAGDKLGSALFTGSLNSYNTSGSFAYLLRQYGLATGFNSGNITGEADGRVYNIYDEPLFFIRSGLASQYGLYRAGARGYLWSSVVYNAQYAYSLYFYDGSSVFPSDWNGSHNGMPIRCLATGGWLDSYPEYSDTGNANISVTVSPVISIDATSSMTSDVDFTTIANGSITADISSNMAYQVLLSTIQTALERNPQVENNNIPMITIDQDITAGTSSWGIKKKLSATTGQPGDITNASVYSPIGITNTETGEDNKVLFFRSATAEKRTLDFSVGIAVDPKLPSGTYSTEVTITAVAM